ncbi:MAG: VCBS repeat-containing protein [Myxococcales bacterium]|nr:VCBS repeat-containing protein [Myxococcales bacterium]
MRSTQRFLIFLFFFSIHFSVHAQSSSGVAPNVLVLPTGPGSISGMGENVQANLNMGLMSYPVKIIVPKGRGTATPTISVVYSSSAGAGMMGIGWNLNAGGSVERLTVRGLPTYTNADQFYAGGELVKIPNSTVYRARMESGFVRYQWIQQDANDQKGYWLAEYPDGSKGYYGADSKGQIVSTSQVVGLKGTFRWELVTFVDRNGNRVEYTYTKDASQTYLDQISWVFDAQNTPLYQVNFSYESRPDPISDGKPGFDMQTKQRLKELVINSDGKRFRSYKFTFEDATGLSRLIKVERFGRDGTSRYPIAFNMKYSDATFSPQNSRLVQMPTALGINFGNGDADFIDMNGDGLPDVVNTAPAAHRFFINQLTLTPDLKQDKHDFPAALAKDNPNPINAKTSTPSVQLMDFNGDGYTDLVDAVGKKIYINLGNSKWEDASQSLVSFPVTQGDPNIRFFDYNGDKKIDIIRSDGTGTSYWINDGKGSWTAVTGDTNIGRSFSTDRLRLIDINGDGLMDVVHITSSSLRYRKYLGYGKWSDWIDMTVPGIDQYPLSTQAQFSDINGDGLADMVAFLGTSIVYFVNKNGMAFEAGTQLQKFEGIDLPDSTQSSIRIADMNGNGSRDIVWIDSSGKVTYLELFNKRPNLMTEISNEIGQRINIEYGSSVYFYLRDQVCDKAKDAACSGPWLNKMPMPFTLVTKIATWSSRSDKPTDQAQPAAEERPQIQTVYYHNGFYDGNEKKFRGFRHVETLFDGDASVGARKEEIKYDVGDTDSYFHGLLLEQTISDNQGKIFQQIRKNWKECDVALGTVDGKTLTPPVRFICPSTQEFTEIEGENDPNKWRIRFNEYVHDGFGNIVQMNALGEKAKQGDEQYTASEFITPQDPNSPTAKWFLRATQRVRHCEAPPQGNNNCAEILYFFDGPAFTGLAAGQIEKGNITRIRMRREIGKDVWLEPHLKEYDTYGNVIRSKDISGNTRTYTWDDRFNRFPVQEEMTVGGQVLKASTRWDYQYNQVVESTDNNGQITSYRYDVFGRLTAVLKPGDATDKPSSRYRYEVKAPISQVIHESMSAPNGNYDRQVVQCVDGQGRLLANASLIGPGQYQIFSHTEYNRLNGAAILWNSYVHSQPCAFTAPPGTPQTEQFFDGLNRLLKKVHPDGSFERNVYQPFIRLEYDEEDNDPNSPHFDTPKTQIMDGQARLIEEIVLPKKGEPQSTKFRYTTLNVYNRPMVLEVTYPNGSKKTNTFDLIGSLQKITDPDRSEITFTRGDRYQLSQQTDARGKQQLFTYDEIGRLKTVQNKDEPQSLVTYTYDTPQAELPTATNVLGRLAKVEYQTGAYLFSYNVRGEIEQQRQILHGVNFDSMYAYTLDGMLLKQITPDGKEFTIQRDASGQILGMSGIINKIVYGSNGALASWEAANGIVTKYTYNDRLWPTQIDVKNGEILQINYTYDRYGNIKDLKQVHGTQNFQHTYQYDDLYRLTQASLLGGQETLSYQFDILGNFTAKSSSLADKSPAHVGNYTFDPKQIHAATTAGTLKLSYDVAGNALQRGDLSMTWDAQGRRLETQRNNQTVMRSWYGSGDAQVIKEANGLHTFYVSDNIEIREGVPAMYIKLADARIASVTMPKLKSVFFDDLAPSTEQSNTMTPQPDGQISAGDAWLYHGARQKILTVPTKTRPVDLDLTRDMLQASVDRLLDGDTPQTRYYHNDHLHSVRAITDEKGQVVGRSHYYPYGQVREQSGELPAYSYMGAELEKETGFLRFHSRSLDPKTGRWLRPDPAFEQIGANNDEWNSYGMVQSNPIRMREVGGTMSNDGIVHFSNDSHVQDGLNIGLPAAIFVLGSAAYLTYSFKVAKRDYGGPKEQKRMGGLSKIGMVASNVSFGLSLAALGMQQYRSNETAVNALNYAALGLATVAEGLNVYRAFRKHDVAKKGGARIIGPATATASAVSGVGQIVGIALIGFSQPNEVQVAVGLAASAASTLASSFLMTRLQDAKKRADGVLSLGGRNSFTDHLKTKNFFGFSTAAAPQAPAAQSTRRRGSSAGKIRRK